MIRAQEALKGRAAEAPGRESVAPALPDRASRDTNRRCERPTPGSPRALRVHPAGDQLPERPSQGDAPAITAPAALPVEAACRTPPRADKARLTEGARVARRDIRLRLPA